LIRFLPFTLFIRFKEKDSYAVQGYALYKEGVVKINNLTKVLVKGFPSSE